MKHATIISCCLATLFAGGCYTTPGMRDRAAQLGAELSTYRDGQSYRIKRINADYNAAFAGMIEELASVKAAQLDLDREVQAQRIADRIIVDKNATLRQTFRDSFASAVDAQRTAIAQADLALAATRDAYARVPYQDAKLKLDDIDQVIGNLRILAAKEDQQRTATEFIESVVRVYEQLREEADKEKEDQDKKDAKADAKAVAAKK